MHSSLVRFICESYVGLMSLGSVCVCVLPYIGISICVSKLCASKQSAHSLLLGPWHFATLPYSVRFCAVSDPSFALSPCCWVARIFLHFNPLEVLCDVLQHFSWALEVVVHASL